MRASYVLATITILFSVSFLVVTFQMPESRSTTTVDSAAWPTIILVFMLIMAILLIINTLVKGAKDNGTTEEEEEEKFQIPVNEGNVLVRYRHLFLIASIVVYLTLLPILGFLIVTPLFFVFLCWLLGMKHWLKVILFTLVSNLVIFGLFIHLLGIPFPRGIGIFRTISSFIY